ncbi:MAG: hypothetical protein WC455_17080 [Dehalococcoidia bacterium]|jgi:hypothetical protein
MAYTTTAAVQALNPKRTYDATTTPTLTQVDTYITDIAAEIDAALQSRGFTTPITAGGTTTEFYAFICALNARGAAALAEQAMFPEGRGLMTTPGSSSAYWKQYQDGLKWLREGKLPTGTTGEAPLPFSFYERNQGNDDEPGSDTPEWQKPKFGMNKDF